MKKVIITGATGFIGRHLLDYFKDNNVEVYAVSRRPDNSFTDVNWIIGDLKNLDDELLKQFDAHIDKESPFDCLYHLAWEGVMAGDKNLYEKQKSNIEIINNIIKICEYTGCTHIINSGTVAEYVREDGLISDKCVPSPADLYGAMKVSCRNILEVMCKEKGIDIINTIVCSTFGEYRSDDNVVSYTIKTLLNNDTPRFGALNQMWDFLYVKDVAYALYLIGEKGIYGKTYGIGSGRYKRLHEYINDIHDIMGSTADMDIGALEQKYVKVLNSCVDSYQLQKDTGFSPRYSFEEGIKRTVEYYRNED